jgi:hypothetical protein
MPDDLAKHPRCRGTGLPACSPFVSRLRISGATPDGKLPASSASQYFLIRDGQKAGPFKREEVVTLLHIGHATPRDLGWQEGQSGWCPLGELPGVGPIVRAPSATKPPPGLRPTTIWTGRTSGPCCLGRWPIPSG